MISKDKQPLKDLVFNKVNFVIGFVILSHPHFDHFSGMVELLDFCEIHNVPIRRFGHSMAVNPQYLNWANIDDNHTSLLKRMIDKVTIMQSSGKVQKIVNTLEEWSCILSDDFKIICLAPGDNEMRDFTKRVQFYKNSGNELRASRAANLLSTIFLIKFSNTFVILSSDATPDSLLRLSDKSQDIFCDTELILGQVPHHGSVENHQINLWESFSYNDNCPVVISAGQHQRYLHPHKSVVQDFYDHRFKIYSTNLVNGVEEFVNESFDLFALKLDYISEVIEVAQFEGDQVFELIKSKYERLL